MTTETGKLAEALAKAQAQIKGAVKDATNPHFKSKYADLASVWDACRKPLADNGLSVTQSGRVTEYGPVLVTTLLHTSGAFVTGEIPLLMGKQDMQALGSALTYARRYGLAAMVGVVADDDDGNAAVAAKAEPVKAKAPAGYDDWLIDFEAAADTGSKALSDAWQSTSKDFRLHYNATKTDADRAKLRERAQKADAQVPA